MSLSLTLAPAYMHPLIHPLIILLYASPCIQESERAIDKRAEKLLKAKKRLQSGEIMEALREEFGAAPEVCCHFYTKCG